MNLDILRAFFGWCTVLNGVLLALSSLLFLLAGDWVYQIHGLWFRMPRETMTEKIYAIFGIWKILVIVFNISPWFALVLMT